MADGLAGNQQSSNWLLDWIRNSAVGQRLVNTAEQQQNAPVRQQIIDAGVDINRQLPPAQLPAPRAPAGYTMEDMIRAARQPRQYDQFGREIPRR